MPVDEVARLCAKLPALLDAEADAHDSPLVSALEVAWLEGRAGSTPTGGDWVARSIHEWPEFCLRWREDAGGTETVGVSTIMDFAGATHGSAPARLAMLVYELIGGHRRAVAGHAISPVAALNEAGNDVVARAVRGGFADCRGFWRAWEGAMAGQIAERGRRGGGVPGRELRIPRWLLDRAQPGDVLRLEPGDLSTHPPVRLVARAQFRLGRSRSQSDFPVRAGVAGQQDSESSKQLSRVHACAEATAAGLALRDGDGEKPSTNGSTFNDAALDPTQPMALTGTGVLTFGAAGAGYRLQVVPLPGRRLSDARIANLADWGGAPSDAAPLHAEHGAVIFEPLDGQPVLLNAVWLFSEICCEVTPSGELVWSREEQLGPLAFLYRHGCFWLANLRLTSTAVRLDEGVLESGCIAPLTSGQTLEIGAARFAVSVG